MAATALVNPMRDMPLSTQAPNRVGDGNLADSSSGPEMTISETARLYGVTLRTLRFYEDRGLIRPRREGSARFYRGVDRVRIEMILNGKRLGFTLTEIAELIGQSDPNRGAQSDFETRLAPAQVVSQIDHLERQRREIESAIARLRATHERLAQAESI
jgi:DNA-binding transcriptional MerR regulator